MNLKNLNEVVNYQRNISKIITFKRIAKRERKHYNGGRYMGKNEGEQGYIRTSKGGISSTPYDDVFRTMLNDCARFILPILNEVFGEDYDGTEEIIFANDYHFKNMQDGEEEKIITDSSFKVITCRSSGDNRV